jgi:hypothetical protein
MNETAKPAPQARRARGARRIRGLTLEARPVGMLLGGAWGYCPKASRSASESGSPAALIAVAAPAMSYSVRW